MSKTLEQKNTRYLLMWLPLVLLFGSGIFYGMLTMHAEHTQEKILELKQQNISNAYFANPSGMPMEIQGEYSIKEGLATRSIVFLEPGDTTLLFTAPRNEVSYKTLTRYYNINGKSYTVTTFVSSKEFFHLTIKVFITQAFVFLLLLMAIVLINRTSSLVLWRPFYDTLQKTSEYDVIHNKNFQLKGETGITEFNQLNSELNRLIEKVNLAYSNQKNFVENASHEIQTPLAIIRSKLELLINEPGLTEKTAALLSDITEANERLSQMNKSLLLLAKIDNNQFPEQEPVNISLLLEKILNSYQEHYDNFPALTKSIVQNVFITANPALVEILFSNLIKNAVVHNITAGFIHITLLSNECIIENSGPAITGDPELLFARFSKGSADTKTTGLGLALAKQVAQLYKMDLRYQYDRGKHIITLVFAGS